MSKETVNIGDTGQQLINKLSNNFTELYNREETDPIYSADKASIALKSEVTALTAAMALALDEKTDNDDVRLADAREPLAHKHNPTDINDGLIKAGSNVSVIRNSTTGEYTINSTGGGDGTGTNDYNDLINLPTIEGAELKGDIALEDIGAQPEGDYVTRDELEDYIDDIAEITDYNELDNIPRINNIPLKDNVSLEDIGAQSKGNYATQNELSAVYDSINTISSELGEHIDDSDIHMPKGGSAKQILTKQSNTDYDIDWETIEQITDYNELNNIPTINNIPLQGDLTNNDLGLVDSDDLSEIENNLEEHIYDNLVHLPNNGSVGQVPTKQDDDSIEWETPVTTLETDDSTETIEINFDIIETAISEHSVNPVSHMDIRTLVNEAISTARNMRLAKTFDTIEDLDDWLNVQENIDSLTVGFMFIILEQDSPNYIWTGELVKPIDMGDIDLTDYYNIEQITALLDDKPSIDTVNSAMSLKLDEAVFDVFVAENAEIINSIIDDLDNINDELIEIFKIPEGEENQVLNGIGTPINLKTINGNSLFIEDENDTDIIIKNDIAWLPNIDEDYNLTFTRSASNAAPDSVNIKGEKGERGNDGVIAPTDGFFNIYLDGHGNLIMNIVDNAERPLRFDEETGNLYAIIN